MQSSRNIRYDIFVVIVVAVILFLSASLATYDGRDNLSALPSALTYIHQPDIQFYPQNQQIQNACGLFGAWTADLLYSVLGWSAWLNIVGLVALEFALVKNQTVIAPWMRTLGWSMTLLATTTLASYLVPRDWSQAVIGPGGYLGALCHTALEQHVAQAGGIILSFGVLAVGMMMWTEYLAFTAGRLMFAPALVAATRILPFGLLHGFLRWFNGERATQIVRSFRELRTANSQSTSESDEERSSIDNTDLPRTIKIKAGGESSELSAETIRLKPSVAGATTTDATSATDSETIESEEPTILPLAAAKKVRVESDENIDDESDEESLDEDIDDETNSEVDEPTDPVSVHAKPHFTIKGNAKAKTNTERDQVIQQLNQASALDAPTVYELPPIDLLLTGDSVSFEDQKREALQKAEVLERTCKEFGYNVRVVEIETGPVISQYEIQLEAGLRLQKISALADDLAIALRVPSVRIVAPIPGKNTVGVEVPNESRQLVRLREVIEQSEAKTRKMKIPLFLGKDAVGAPLVVDLATLPHLLIAGRTGTGKSVCLNAIITSIMMTRRPDEVRMLMIDPKMVELSGYARLPHLMHPVVTDMRKAEAILAWAVDKMEERYALLARAGVRHVTTYNQLGQEELYDRLQPESDEEKQAIPMNLPFIVIVADEMADLMMTSGKEVEQHIIRLAQKSRAVGIHLILATQKPTVDVITGLIKSNLPARIAFQVASKMDSRVVLDAMGADKLLGNGDMLFLWPGTSTLLRGQGTYLSDDEIEAVTEAVSTVEQNFVHELLHIKVQPKEDTEETGGRLPNRDEVYASAVEVVIREGRGSVSLLQRALGIGYGRAARLIDFMEEDGIVGTYNGSKSRDVVMTMDQWHRLQSGAGESADEIAQSIITPAIRPTPIKAPSISTGRVTKLSASAPSSAVAKPAVSKPDSATVSKPKSASKAASVPFEVDEDEDEMNSSDSDSLDGDQEYDSDDADLVDLHEFTGDDELEYEDVGDDEDDEPEDD